MGKKLYVGNLTYDMTEADVKQLFEQFGTIDSVAVIMDRDSGRSKGFGFVEMPMAGEAKIAIKSLNNKTIGSNKIRVKKAEVKNT